MLTFKHPHTKKLRTQEGCITNRHTKHTQRNIHRHNQIHKTKKDRLKHTQSHTNRRIKRHRQSHL